MREAGAAFASRLQGLQKKHHQGIPGIGIFCRLNCMEIVYSCLVDDLQGGSDGLLCEVAALLGKALLLVQGMHCLSPTSCRVAQIKSKNVSSGDVAELADFFRHWGLLIQPMSKPSISLELKAQVRYKAPQDCRGILLHWHCFGRQVLGSRSHAVAVQTAEALGSRTIPRESKSRVAKSREFRPQSASNFSSSRRQRMMPEA